jgi:glycosyltransferase involved in cell wall biosynthesis
MRVGFDARAAAEVKAGRGRVVRELLRAIATLDDDHTFVLYCREPAPELELDDRFRWKQLAARDPLWHMRAASAARHDCDVFFSTNSYLTAWFTRVPTVVLVYDLIAFVPGTRPQRRAQLIEHATIRLAVHRARRLLCISHATEHDLIERFPRARGKSAVVQLAADERFGAELPAGRFEEVRERYGLERPFVLSAATLEPRKNLPRLIEAYAGLPPAVRERHRLVLVGPSGWEMDATLRSAGAHAGDVELLGYVPDEDLAALYQLCTLFCYPSLYEGFGLPVLEALQSGAPTIASRTPSLVEVAAGAARYVDPLDVDDIRAAIAELLADGDARAELSLRGRERATSFSWRRAARETLDELVGVAGYRI